jgi:DNA polymerase-3 subunit delta'
MRFQEIPGQNEIKKKLIQTVLDQRVSHAQLFFGPADSGKLALSIAYAQFINCTGRKGNDMDSCGSCPSCIKYQKLIHPDLHFIYPVSTTKKVSKKPKSRDFLEYWRNFLTENNYSVSLPGWYEAIEIENKQGIINAEDCNEIISTLGYKSYESEYKVMILWMVEKLYPLAAPKILKILEEPPEKTLFLLISEDPEQVIRTILSRTLMIRIPGMGVADSAQGEDDLVYFEQFRQWMRLCYSGKVTDLIQFSGEISRSGREKQKGFLIYGLKILDLCVALNFRESQDLIPEGDKRTFVTNFSPIIHTASVSSFSDLFNSAIYHIERNVHSPTLFLDLSLKIVALFKPNFLPL